MGGGWRQAGVLAACGIIALKNMLERLKEDHANARLLADLCRKVEGIEVLHVETNMCFLGSKIPGVSTRTLELALNEAGLLCFGESVGIRCVTHYGIEESDIRKAAEIVSNVAHNLKNQTKVGV